MQTVEYLDQLRTLAGRLADANAALLAWDQIEAQERRSQHGHRDDPVQRPSLSRQALKLQLILLAADMSRLEQEMCATAAPANN